MDGDAADLGTGAPPEGRDRTKIVGESDNDSSGGMDGSAGGGSSAGASGVPQKRGRRRAAPEPPPAPVLDDAELRGALEAILLVVDQPVSELVLAEVLEQAPERVGAMLDEIAAGYTAAGHGFELRRAAGGWRLYTRPEYAGYVERFVLDGQSVRLTQAALETLAVVAYRQPVTRSRISAIRGVNCDGVLRTLVGRGLVEECGTEADSGAFLYRTTTLFLEKLGLNSVDDLPPLAPFLPDDVEELADATR
ncbi:SMC-Scp complex subunit ScpB [Micromonospora sp. NPDC051300]|uniref:SMC-Scp complex subunit ScpB n=1 Tax=Micromonospora sp. NPDC051300 TaxID=3364286 RepID=UPI00379EFC0F